jgi:hypothetical protein
MPSETPNDATERVAPTRRPTGSESVHGKALPLPTLAEAVVAVSVDVTKTAHLRAVLYPRRAL